MKAYRKEKKSIDRNLTEGNEYRTIILFVLPLLLGNIFQQLYNVVDSIVVGRILGKDALAAVGASYNIINIMLAIAMGLTIGISILISKQYGAQEYHRIQISIDTGMTITIVAAVIIMLFGIIKAESIMKLFQVPSSIMQDAVAYMSIILIGTIPMFCYNSITNYLRGLGDTSTPLYFLIISSVLNVILDILFVKMFSMGVKGAAAATVIAQYISFIAITLYVNRNSKFRINFYKLKFDFKILREGLAIGIPAMLQQLFISFGSSVIQILINSYGVIVISAYSAASRIDGFAALPAVSIGRAVSNYTAQNIGAGATDRVKRGIQAGAVIVAITTSVITILVFAFPQGLMKLFCDSKEVGLAGTEYLRIVCIFYIVFGMMQLLNGVLLGKGKAFISMLSTIGSFILLQVPAAVILSRWIGVNGIWIAAPIGWVGGLAIRFWYLHRRT